MCYSNTLQWRRNTIPHWYWFGAMHGTVPCWLWTNREYVNIDAWLNFKVLLAGIRCTLRLKLHAHVFLKYTAIMAMTHGYDFDFVWIYGTIRCRIVFGRAESTLVLLGACFELVKGSKLVLLGVGYTDCNRTLMWCQIQIQWWWRHTAVRWLFWFLVNIWNGVVLALDEQGVRWYWCIWTCHCLVFDGVVGASCDVQLHRNGDDTWICVNSDFGWIYGTVLCCLWTCREYVYQYYWCIFVLEGVVAWCLRCLVRFLIRLQW